MFFECKMDKFFKESFINVHFHAFKFNLANNFLLTSLRFWLKLNKKIIYSFLIIHFIVIMSQQRKITSRRLCENYNYTNNCYRN